MSKADQPANDALDALIDRLHEQGRLRVWSLVVTIFGDAVVPRGGRVALATLQQIMERLRIEPGALRTAMSRLANDRWVARERQGRNSFFSLDAHGRHAFDLATRRIYAGTAPVWAGKWTVAIAPPGSSNAVDLASHGFVRVNAAVFLRAETEDATDASQELAEMLVIHGESAEHPEAIRALWPSQEVSEAYAAFAGSFGPLHDALVAGACLRGIDAVAARTLMIHGWRRIVLRDPGLPAALLPNDWPAERARTMAREIYAQLVAPSEAWFDEAGLSAIADLERFAARWR